MHGACTKRLYFHFRSKIGHRRVPQPRFPPRRKNFGNSAINKGYIAYKDCENFGDSRTLKADIGLLNICIGFHDLLA